MDLISVIVPVYKVEPYLDRCVQSIVDQTYTNLEIILVDDGSPDNCPAMCDAWAAKDSRIRVIHQTNLGGGAARNVALDIAHGELISFIDSDDYISPGMLEHLHELIVSGADIAECSYVKVYGDHVSFDETDLSVSFYEVQDALREHIRDSIFRQLIWNKLYRREVIGDIRFPVGKKIDDEYFTYLVLGNAKILVRSEKECYAYRQQETSVMHTVSPEIRVESIKAKLLRHTYISEQFPELTDDSVRNVFFSCVYLGQLALRDTCDGSKAQISYLEQVVNTQCLESFATNLKEKVWVFLARTNFCFTCRVRNFLKIGL